MTPEQQRLFIRALQFGAATGTTDRFKCLIAYTHCNPDLKKELISAFAAFERGCGHCHETAIALEGMTDEQYWQWVQANYGEIVSV